MLKAEMKNGPLKHSRRTGDSLLLRETKSELVLVSRLSRFISSGLERLNPALPPEAITAAVDELTRGMLLPRLFPGQVPLASETQTKQNAGSER